jgi:hypothetical protein
MIGGFTFGASKTSLPTKHTSTSLAIDMFVRPSSGCGDLLVKTKENSSFVFS